jgi:hypothetical protein
MFDPIDPKELQQALYASAAAVSFCFIFHDRFEMNLNRKQIFHQIQPMTMN